jgi:hypothetical protein
LAESEGDKESERKVRKSRCSINELINEWIYYGVEIMSGRSRE